MAADKLEVKVYEGDTECEDANKVKKGDFLKMHYTGTIDESSPTGEKGKQFDSSRTRDSTFDFAVGTGQVIKGWDEGLVGLCKGAKATLIIPAEMGYGATGAGGDIPGGATLNFDVEVVDIGAAPEEKNLFEELDSDNNHELTAEEIEAFFKKQGAPMPEGLMKDEDKNGDGVVSWDEFGGPKGTTNPKEDKKEL